jgi:hypothetical protein
MLNKSFPAFSPLLFAVFGASGQTSQVGTSPELGLWLCNKSMSPFVEAVEGEVQTEEPQGNT